MRSNRQVTRRAFHGSSGEPSSGRVTGNPDLILRSARKVGISISSPQARGSVRSKLLTNSMSSLHRLKLVATSLALVGNPGRARAK